MPEVSLIDLGLTDYKSAWDFQENLFQKIIQKKIANRSKPVADLTPNYLIFCEHYPVYTLGKSGNPQNLLLNDKRLAEIGASYFPINRGGDITFHGPGQLVMYPIFDLDHFFSDIHKYLRFLEEAVILTLKHFGIIADRYPEYTGVWVEPENQNARKICAIGVRASRWVTMHGIGFNINTDLNYFNHLIPCGIEDKSVTSMQKELGALVDVENVKTVLLDNMAQLFQFRYL